MVYISLPRMHINNVYIFLTQSTKLALFLLNEVTWVLFIFHIKYFQGKQSLSSLGESGDVSSCVTDPSPRSRKAFFVGDFLAAPAKTYILASRNSDGQFSSSSVP